MEFLEYEWVIHERDFNLTSVLRSLTFSAQTQGHLTASWHLRMHPKSHEGAPEGFCPVYLVCEKTSIYPLQVSYAFTLHNANVRSSRVAKDTQIFEAGKGWGAHRLIPVAEVIDPKEGFNQNGRITLSIELSYALQKYTVK